jgi:hypothetical protein
VASDQLFYKNKIRDSKAYARSKVKKSPYEVLHIICEGQTECFYIKALIKFCRLNTANVFVGVSTGSAPISIIEEAFKNAKDHPDIDRFICVFDRDNHESYQRALEKLRDHKSHHST